MVFDRHYEICSFSGDKCKVIEGNCCDYFEHVLLNVPEKSRLPGYDYSKLSAQYAQQTGAKVSSKIKQRRCECGEPLGYRQRYCLKCSMNRKKAANRNRQRKYRFANTST